jgi:hypothetical protein
MLQKSAMTNLTRDEAEFRFNEASAAPGCVAGLIAQADGLWTVWVVWDDGGQPVTAAELSGFEHAPQVAQAAGAALGALSARFESNGDPAALGFDTTGGHSYGAYQIATKTGTMAKFLDFLAHQQPAMAAALNAAGGAAGALAGTPGFKQAWQGLAADPLFFAAQHAYIETSHYQPFAAKLKSGLGLNLAERGAALRDVAWSVAVQHGPGNKVFANALHSHNVATMSDRDIIDAVYTERAKLDKYFPSSRPQVKVALANRFEDERERAWLAAAGGVMA